MYARIMILPSWMFLSKTPWRTGWHTGHTLPLNVVRVNRGRRGSHSLRSPQNYGMNELHEFFSASCFPVLPSWSVSNLQTFLYLPDIFWLRLLMAWVCGTYLMHTNWKRNIQGPTCLGNTWMNRSHWPLWHFGASACTQCIHRALGSCPISSYLCHFSSRRHGFGCGTCSVAPGSWAHCAASTSRGCEGDATLGRRGTCTDKKHIERGGGAWCDTNDNLYDCMSASIVHPCAWQFRNKLAPLAYYSEI